MPVDGNGTGWRVMKKDKITHSADYMRGYQAGRKSRPHFSERAKLFQLEREHAALKDVVLIYKEMISDAIIIRHILTKAGYEDAYIQSIIEKCTIKGEG